jgi:hypothetical protein
MKWLFPIVLLFVGCDNSNSDVDKIIKAKQIVLGKINFPDTADFHEMKTHVQGNNVSLTVTAKNAFGVPATQTFTVRVD